MAEYVWPAQGTATVLGKEIDRLDGAVKATGTAKYSYDINPAGMLFAKLLGCPHAHCKITAIDTAAAMKVPGVVAIELLKAVGNEIRWQGDHLAAVAAESEAAAAAGCAAIKVEYEVLDVYVGDSDLEAAKAAGRTAAAGKNVQLVNEAPDGANEEEFADQEFKRLLDASAAVVHGSYGIHAITHMCLEPHGSTCEWTDGKLTAHLSTQNVSGTAGQFADPLGITAGDVTVHCDYIGGGFGSKFAADVWGVTCAKLARDTKRPVKLMLDRDLELKIAGARPSGFIDVKIGADKDGVVQVWDSHHWGSSGPQGGGVSQTVIPYVFNPPNRRRVQTAIQTNVGPDRAWRAPNHPQACVLSQCAYDDIAAKLGLDSYDVFMRNLGSVSNGKSAVYARQMEIAAGLMDWKKKWHAHGKGAVEGSIVRGLGMAIHTWGGGGHPSQCLYRIHPDGGVELLMGTQDLGTGARTALAIVAAETFGLPVEAIRVQIGSSKYPESGASGGSTTIGGITEASRRGGLDALEQLFAKVAPKLNAKPEELEARGGRIGVRGAPDRSVTWAQACQTLGMSPLEVRGQFVRGSRDPKTGAGSKLSSSQVAGVQMAEVAVDRDTGVVRMTKFVAVQDIGLVVNRKAAASQIYGAVIMGIAYALFEERIMDSAGSFVNSQIADYRLPRLGDIGEIVVHFDEPAEEYQRGVIGLGEPPVIAPGAAISNAVANALGVRVPVLPMAPKRVLDAIQKGGKA